MLLYYISYIIYVLYCHYISSLLSEPVITRPGSDPSRPWLHAKVANNRFFILVIINIFGILFITGPELSPQKLVFGKSGESGESGYVGESGDEGEVQKLLYFFLPHGEKYRWGIFWLTLSDGIWTRNKSSPGKYKT